MHLISNLRIFAALASIFVPLTSAAAGVDVQIASLTAANTSWLYYPTQFTQGIVPKAIHSHNDYWREVPLLTALSFGVASVEADVWLINNKLYVGHEKAALTEERTFSALYVEPLVSIVKGQNPESAFNMNASSINGVFDTSSSTPLQLLVDIKTDGTQTFPFVVQALEPLRELGYLTTFSNDTLTRSAITVVGTGNTPLETVKAMSIRDVFFDAPLTGLSADSGTIWDATLSPVASTDYEIAVGWDGRGNISEAQLTNLTRFVEDAHLRGIKARFWDTPGWPISARNAVWRQLLEAGADWLNADDLQAASSF
ncbi:hypothetical protein Moror_43 [Moniliophthora roreri MCA 2997]|uniref:Altered inheritance of mitochondria protein 6 n=1 Tax=Moniliophthora roreri (strain MCA 2997) TaxID=1381753 RepID=V2XGH4_MONRO|nr:hypothetical protein Moror_43 [Moniliophthora roreri MCA 2997]